jgi:CxxC motif-containing protein
MRYILFLLLSFSFSTGFCQDQNDLPQRQPYKLKMPVDKNSVYEMDVPTSAFVQNNNIVQIYPGEKIFLEAKIINDSLRLKSVKEIKNPEKTITVSCTQAVTKGKHENIMLKIENPFDKDLYYSASMYLMRSSKWVPTNVYPVKAKLIAFEMWPDVIITLTLTDWKLL